MRRLPAAILPVLLVSVAGLDLGGPPADSGAPMAPGTDLLPPELVLSVDALGALVAYGTDNADPEPDVADVLTAKTAGARRTAMHQIAVSDLSGHRLDAVVEVSLERRALTGPPKAMLVRVVTLEYDDLGVAEPPRNHLEVVWGEAGRIRQGLHVAGRLAAEADFDGAQTAIRAVTPPSHGRRIEFDAAGHLLLELMTDRGQLTMRTTMPAGGDAGTDWEKLLAEPVPPHNSHGDPGFRDTSEFALGRVAVNLILLESNGASGPNQENWTATRRTQVINEVTAALTFWQNQATAANLPLTFVLDTSRATTPIATGIEPITRCGANTAGCFSFDDRWITDAMTALGYSNFATTTLNMRQFVNDRRNATNAQWGFLIFVVDSLNDADGKFSNNFFAYGKWLGGPALVMTYDNENWGIANMDRVAAHEIGHMFYALDEYAASGCTTTQMTGYLNVNNRHCLNGPNPVTCASGNNCLMVDNTLFLPVGTRSQIGWRDGDSDGIPDVLDTVPTTTVTGPPNPSPHYGVSWSGTAQTSPTDNQNPWNPAGEDATLNTIWHPFFLSVDDPDLIPIAGMGIGTQHLAAAGALFFNPGNHSIGLTAQNRIPLAGANFTGQLGPTTTASFHVQGNRNATEVQIEALSPGTVEPSVAAEGNTVLIAYEKVVSGVREVHLVRSTDAGRTWSTPLLIGSPDARPSAAPALAMAGGTALVAYENRTAAGAPDRVVVRRSTDGGASFGAEVSLGSVAHRPAIAMTATAAHILYERLGASPSIECRRSTDGGASWAVAATLSSSAATQPAVAISGSSVHATWTETSGGASNIFYRRSSDGGATWGTAIQVSAAGTTLRRDAAIAAAGSLGHLFWMDERSVGGTPVSDVVYARSADSGQTWGTPTVLVNGQLGTGAGALYSNTSGLSPVAVGSDIHLIYESNWSSSFTTFFYMRSDDGGLTWSPSVHPAPSPVGIVFPSRPALAAAGTDLHLAWWDQRLVNLGQGLYYRYFR